VTRSRSCARLGVTHFVSVVVVCGVVALVLAQLPASASVAADTDAVAGATSDQTSGDRDWTADPAGLDTPDSDDDADGSDDAPGASAAVAIAPHHTARAGESWHRVHVGTRPVFSRPSDGQSLRGPPSAHGDPSARPRRLRRRDRFDATRPLLHAAGNRPAHLFSRFFGDSDYSRAAPDRERLRAP
jgi:hypothetical protein